MNDFKLTKSRDMEYFLGQNLVIYVETRILIKVSLF